LLDARAPREDFGRTCSQVSGKVFIRPGKKSRVAFAEAVVKFYGTGETYLSTYCRLKEILSALMAQIE